VLRKFVDEVFFPDAQALQEKGKKPSKHIFEEFAKMNIHAMRLGPGKHLMGRTLMYGTVKPEEVRYSFSSMLIRLIRISLTTSMS
jgi:hypothetical protein